MTAGPVMSIPDRTCGSLTEWAGFVQSVSHLLQRDPAQFFQEAANLPDASAPGQAARQRQERGLERRPWLRQENKAQRRSPCLATLTGHSGDVACCAYSPDGAQIVSGSTDGTLRLWKSRTGESVGVLGGHGRNGIERCAYSPDGTMILSAVGEIPSTGPVRPMMSLMMGLPGHALAAPAPTAVGDASLWDAKTGTHLRAFTRGNDCRGKIVTCGFSPDGSRVMAGGGEYSPGWLKVWDAASGTEVLSVAGKRRLCAGGWSPDGRSLLAAWDGGGSLQVLDAASGQVRMTLSAGRQDPTACAWSPDGRLILYADFTHLWLWDAHSGEQVRDFEPRSFSVQECAFSPDGARFVSRSVGDSDTAFTVWDVKSGEQLAWLGSGFSSLERFAFSRDGSKLAVATGTAVRVWTAASGEITELEGHGGLVRACGFSPDGAEVVSASCDKTLKVWDPEIARRAKAGKAPEEPAGRLISIPGGLLATQEYEFVRIADISATKSGSDVHIIKRWDPDSGALRATLRLAFRVRRQVVSTFDIASTLAGWAFSPDGRVLASWGHNERSEAELFIWNAATGDRIGELRGHQHPVRACGFSTDGTRLASADGEDVRIWDVASLSEIARIAAKADSVMHGPTGRTLLIDGGFGGLTLVHGQTGAVLFTLKARRPFAFSPDGKTILARGEEGRTGLYDTATGSPTGVLDDGGRAGEGPCSFSPDGTLAATSGKGVLIVWDVRTGLEVAVLPGEFPYAFSPDGTMMAFSGEGKRLAVWHLKPTGPLCERDTSGFVSAVHWRPDSRRLVVSGGAGRVQFLELINFG